ncbi:ATP-binding protein, partial [Stenotrophomonas maltophilia]
RERHEERAHDDGLGLGLVISNAIVTEAGGTLRVDNRDGAVFTITLPRAL